MSTCYRDSAVMLHFAVSLGDALGHFRQGRMLAAARDLFTATNARSLGSVLGGLGTLRNFVRARPQ
jgi:hypothetical protein